MVNMLTRTKLSYASMAWKNPGSFYQPVSAVNQYSTLKMFGRLPSVIAPVRCCDHCWHRGCWASQSLSFKWSKMHCDPQDCLSCDHKEYFTQYHIKWTKASCRVESSKWDNLDDQVGYSNFLGVLSSVFGPTGTWPIHWVSMAMAMAQGPTMSTANRVFRWVQAQQASRSTSTNHGDISTAMFVSSDIPNAPFPYREMGICGDDLRVHV